MDTITVNRKAAEKPAADQLPTPKRQRGFKPSKSLLLKFLLAVVLIGSVATAVIMTLRYNDLKKDPNQITQAQQKGITDKVGKLIDLPTDEQPSIATVSDKEKLKDQAFFKSAQNGDTLLIYTNAKKAILYRESSNRIVEVAPIAIDTTAGGTQPAAPTGDKKQ